MALSVSLKLILATSAIIVVSVGSTMAVMGIISGRETQESVTRSIELAAGAAANEIKGDILEASSAGHTMADLIGERHARNLVNRQDIIQSLKLNLQNIPQTTGSWYLGSPDNAFDGRADIINDVSQAANSKGNFTPTWSRRVDGGFDFIAYELNYTESFYETAARSRQMFITEPYRDSGSKDPQLEFSITFPVLSGNKLIGVSGVDIGLGSTSQRLTAMKPLGSGSVSLLSADGLWIAGKDTELLTKPYGGGTGSAELVASLAGGKPTTVYDMQSETGETFSRTFFPFTIPGTAKRWAIVMDIPSSVIAAPINRQLGIMLAGGIAILGLTVLGLWLATARIVQRPLALLGQRMKELASGRIDVTIEGQDRHDEVGAMSKAVQVFKNAAIEQRRLETEAVAAREAQVASRNQQTAIDNARAEDLRSFVYAVEAGFDRLSGGDLTARMDAAVAPEFEPIRQKFNASVAQLENTIGSVVGSVGSMRAGLNQITVAAGDLSQRTEQQAASLEETVAALSEVVRGVDGTAQSADDAKAAAALAQMEAEKGGTIVSQAVAAMSEIEHSSNKIGSIISVIDEIAFQTNLLALNAGVEAARAGEAGRGFAVVAQEVRGLAQRSAEAAKEIKDLISTSSQQVERGVELVSASGRSLEQIVAQVGDVANVITQMARSAREQTVSLKEVSTAADQMDKVTQQNAAMVEETTAAAQSLSGETEQLAGLVEGFRTSAAGRTVTRAPAARAAAKAQVIPNRTVAQMRTTGRGGAVPKTAAVTDSWEEF